MLLFITNASAVYYLYQKPVFCIKRFFFLLNEVLLEDVSDFSELSDEIAASRVDMVAIKKFGASLGQLHKLSHSATNSVVVRDLSKKFRYTTICYSV